MARWDHGSRALARVTTLPPLAPPAAQPRGVRSSTPALLPPEAQFLIRTAGGSGTEALLRRLLNSQFDWLKLCALAQRGRATLIVWQWLPRLRTAPPPGEGAETRGS